MDVAVNKGILASRYIRFLYATSFHVTVGVIFPGDRHLSFFCPLRYIWIVALARHAVGHVTASSMLAMMNRAQ
jgi:hypothetical protein